MFLPFPLFLNVQAGADINKEDSNSATVLKSAAAEGHNDVVAFLLTQVSYGQSNYALCGWHT